MTARWEGQSEWYPGKVEKANDDGTYNIAYDDGDREERAKAHLVARYGPPSRGSGGVVREGRLGQRGRVGS